MKAIFRGLVCLLCCATLCGAAENTAPKKQQGKPATKKKTPSKKKKKQYPKDVHAVLLPDALSGPMKGEEINICQHTRREGHHG